MKKISLILLTVCLLIGVFTGCAPTTPAVEAPASDAPVADAPAAEAPASDAPAQSGDKVKLTFLANEQPQLPRELWQEIADKYMAANENVEIEMIYQPSANVTVRDHAKTLLATDQFPDVMVMASPGDFVPSGALLPFDDADLDIIQEQYISKIGGKTYVVPYKIQVGGAFYNKKIFEENGLNVPKTWDEFVAVCDALVAKGITPIAMGVKDGWPQSVPFFCVQTANLLAKDSNWNAKRMAGETTFADSADFVSGVEMYKTMADKYMPEDRTSITYTQTLEKFYSGDAAMFIMGSWTQGDEKTMEHDFEVGFFPVPSVSGEAILPLWTNEGLAISAKTEHPDIAKDFVRFFLSEPEFAAKFLEIEQLFTPLKENVDYNKTELHKEIEGVLAQSKGISNFYDAVGDNTWFPGVQALFDKLSLDIASDPNLDVNAAIADLDNEFELIRSNQE